MKRRGFLLGVVGAGIVGGFAVSPFSPLPWRLLGAGDVRTRALAEHLGSALHAAGVRAFEQSVQGGLSAERAALELVGDASMREVDTLCEDGDALLAFVATRSRADLAADRTRLVDGWLLSETEVRVGTLLAAGVAP